MKKHLIDLERIFDASKDHPLRYVPETPIELNEKVVFDFQKDESVESKLKKGIALKSISAEISAKLAEMEELAIMDYIENSEKLVDLHTMIEGVDESFSKISNILGNFENKFDGLSENVLNKFENSKIYKTELRNKKLLLESLSNFLKKIKFTKKFVNGCLNVEIQSKHFLDLLLNLEKKFEYINECNFRDTKCINEIRPIFLKCIREFVRKIEVYIRSQFFYMFKKKLIFEKRIDLLRFSYHLTFVKKHDGDKYKVLRSTYLELIENEYYKYFKRLLKKCNRYKSVLRRKNYIVTREKQQNKLVSFISKNSPFKKNRKTKKGEEGKKDVSLSLNLNDRLKSLETKNKRGEDPEEGENSFENFFKEFHGILINKSVMESSFLIDFFSIDKKEASGNFVTFLKVFQNTLKLLNSTFTKIFNNLNDIIIALLLYKLISGLRLKTKNLIIVKYFRKLQVTLWKRILVLIDLNIDTLRSVSITKKIVESERDKYDIVKRYANFLTSVYLVLKEKNERDKISEKMKVSKKLLKSLMNRIAKSEYFRSGRESLIFVMKGTDIILVSLLESNLNNLEEGKSFANSLLMLVEAYSMVEIKTFNKLTGFVRRIMENEIKKSTTLRDIKTIIESKVLGISNRDSTFTEQIKKEIIEVSKFFFDFWKKKIQRIFTNVLMNFPRNLNTQIFILKDIFDLLYKYYHAFSLICKSFKNFKVTTLIGSQKLNSECKNYLEKLEKTHK